MIRNSAIKLLRRLSGLALIGTIMIQAAAWAQLPPQQLALPSNQLPISGYEHARSINSAEFASVDGVQMGGKRVSGLVPDRDIANGQPSFAPAIRAHLAYGTSFATGDQADWTASKSGNGLSKRAEWFTFDKVQHVTFGFLFTLGHQYALVNKLELSENRALPVAIAGSAAIGLGKELYDWRVRSSRHFSTGDLVADSIGILLAVGLILI